MRVVVELAAAAVDGPAAGFVPQEDADQAPREVGRDVPERHSLPEPVGHSTLKSSPRK